MHIFWSYKEQQKYLAKIREVSQNIVETPLEMNSALILYHLSDTPIQRYKNVLLAQLMQLRVVLQRYGE